MKKKFSLEEIAHQVMLNKGFIPDFSEKISEELGHIKAPAAPSGAVRNLTHFLWLSIDNEDSRDLDQLTFAEKERIYIAIADVSSLVKQNGPIDERAAYNTTTVYTPAINFPMLPTNLSHDLTSLNAKEDRLAIVVELKVFEEGRTECIDIYPALVRNKAKLTYPCVGAWLNDRSCPVPIPEMNGLQQQLELQDSIAKKIYHHRTRQGTLEFGVMQLKAVVVDGTPVSIEQQDRNRAHAIIENFMISANIAMSRYLKKHNMPILERIVRVPKRWPRIVELAKAAGEILPKEPNAKALRAFLTEQQRSHPFQFPDISLAIIKLLGRGEYAVTLPGARSLGHFDLAEEEYCHATAPNRRFPDLILQRILKSLFFKTEIPYTKQELFTLAARSTAKAADADRTERQLIKCAAAFLLEKEIGKTFEAMVTGASVKGTWVRLLNPPIEGKLVKGFEKLDVGDFIQVKLTRVNLFKGHIDFQKTGKTEISFKKRPQ